MTSYEVLESFTATEIITAGSICVEARVRYRKPGMITVEYRHYEDPLTAFEERYAGGAEFVAAELTGMQFMHDGHVTWIYDAKNNVVIRKPGQTLYSPLRGASAIAEIGFLHDLTRDFLLRDGGAEMIHGRSAHLLEMKPKVRQRSLLLKEEIFPMPWSRTSFEAELAADRCAFPWVVEKEGEVVAYLVSWLVEDELHVGNIAVAPSLQGEGVGRALFAHCLRAAFERGVTRATLEVRVSNARAIALYEDHGFIPVAMRKGYYSDTGEDALVMLKTIPSRDEGN